MFYSIVYIDVIEQWLRNKLVSKWWWSSCRWRCWKSIICCTRCSLWVPLEQSACISTSICVLFKKSNCNWRSGLSWWLSYIHFGELKFMSKINWKKILYGSISLHKQKKLHRSVFTWNCFWDRSRMAFLYHLTCEGVGSNIKCLVPHASLWKSQGNQILIPLDVYSCAEK